MSDGYEQRMTDVLAGYSCAWYGGRIDVHPLIILKFNAAILRAAMTSSCIVHVARLPGGARLEPSAPFKISHRPQSGMILLVENVEPLNDGL